MDSAHESNVGTDYFNPFFKCLCIFCLITVMGSLGVSAQEDSAFEQGEVLDYLEAADSGYPPGTMYTIVNNAGYLPADAAVGNIPGMEGVKGRWSADILDEPDGGAKITTKILPVQKGDIQLPLDPSRIGETLEIAGIAYTMDVDSTQPGLTGPAQIEMSISREWVKKYGGLEAIRIFRYGSGGTAEVLEPRFLNYDRDTGYINLNADSPHGLGMFTLVAIRSLPAHQPDTAGHEPVTTITPENIISATRESHVSHEVLIGIQTLSFCILLVLLFIGITRSRKSVINKCYKLPVFGLVIRMIQSSSSKR